MDIPTTLLFITIAILAVAFIIRPLLAHQEDEKQPISHPSSTTLRGRANLLAERNRVYRALRDLDFDYQTNKVADQEYVAQRRILMTEGVGILQQLDKLPAPDESPENDPIEAAVLAARDASTRSNS